MGWRMPLEKEGGRCGVRDPGLPSMAPALVGKPAELRASSSPALVGSVVMTGPEDQWV